MIRNRRPFAAAIAAAASIPVLFWGGNVLCGVSGWCGDSSTMVIAGNAAPPYRAVTLAGDSVELAHFIGRPVLLNIWATWCKPCREEMPSLQRLHEEFEEEGLAVIAISVDAAPPGFLRDNYEARMVSTFMEAYRLSLPVWLDPSGRAEKVFRTVGVPTSILLNRDGTIDNFVVGGVDWDDEFYRDLVLDIVGSTTGEATSQSDVGVNGTRE